MTTELVLKERFTEIGKLYSKRPIDKRDLKSAGARQLTVGGPWYVYQENVETLTKMGYILTDSPAIPTRADWHNDPATPAQRAYLVSLGIQLEAGMTKGRAHDLIEAAKSGMLSSIGGEEAEGPQSIGEIY